MLLRSIRKGQRLQMAVDYFWEHILRDGTESLEDVTKRITTGQVLNCSAMYRGQSLSNEDKWCEF